MPVVDEGEALSVSSAMALAKGQLERINVRIIGEVSELSAKRGYKAVYFTIKDESASLPCMMWNNRYAQCGVQLEIGSLIEIKGRFSLYAAKGRMNFDVTSISLAGEGDLRLRVANLAKKLQAEGLMAQEKKLPIPKMPSKIGLVTSPRGATVYDVLRTLRNRFPLSEVLFAGCAVEGTNAPKAMIEALNVVADAGAEVILLIRGGGSFEDHMPFNDEGLARAIAKIPVPIVTGIGHEPDNSISDMVADLRASTPTAAASAVVPDKNDVEFQLASIGGMLTNLVNRQISQYDSQIQRLASSRAISDPQRMLAPYALTIDSLSDRLANSIPNGLLRSKDALGAMRFSLINIGSSLVTRKYRDIETYKGDIKAIGKTFLSRYREAVLQNSAMLDGLSPLGALARGYSITTKENGDIVKSVESIKTGENIRVGVADGYAKCEVKEIDKGVVYAMIGEEDER